MARNKHHGITLSFAALARVFGRLRTSLYQPFVQFDGPTEEESREAVEPGLDAPRPTAKVILFPGAVRPSTTRAPRSLVQGNLISYSDLWYSRAVAKSVPHRPFPSSFA
jgi:hypothetical protein